MFVHWKTNHPHDFEFYNYYTILEILLISHALYSIASFHTKILPEWDNRLTLSATRKDWALRHIPEHPQAARSNLFVRIQTDHHHHHPSSSNICPLESPPSILCLEGTVINPE